MLETSVPVSVSVIPIMRAVMKAIFAIEMVFWILFNFAFKLISPGFLQLQVVVG